MTMPEIAPIVSPVLNPLMSTQVMQREVQEELTMAGEEDVHDYSEAEIGGMWRKYVLFHNSSFVANLV